MSTGIYIYIFYLLYLSIVKRIDTITIILYCNNNRQRNNKRKKNHKGEKKRINEQIKYKKG